MCKLSGIGLEIVIDGAKTDLKLTVEPHPSGKKK